MMIALVQQHSGPDLDDNLRRGKAAFEEAARAGADLIAFAELAFLPFLPRIPAADRPDAGRFAQTVPGPLTEEFGALARKHGVVTVLNLFERDGDRTYDASPVIDADGRWLGTARMIHIMEGPGFHERGYYAPGEESRCVFPTAAGKIGVAICYDRHFPEYMRGLALLGTEIAVIPQAGVADEWGAGLYEGEVRVSALQNGYFAALCNRVGAEDDLSFTGESFVVDPNGAVLARAPRDRDHILFAACDLSLIEACHAHRHFMPDRRPAFYRKLKLTD
ncbi:MAG: carbon-nitrogen hydrolase family protein [Acidobacteriota bacterium]|nr:carbon-nitrogen hydrolase family protein [Acidobacteriota bacterium]